MITKIENKEEEEEEEKRNGMVKKEMKGMQAYIPVRSNSHFDSFINIKSQLYNLFSMKKYIGFIFSGFHHVPGLRLLLVC